MQRSSCPACQAETEIKKVTMIAVDDEGNDVPEDDPCYSTEVVAICCTKCNWYVCPDWRRDNAN